MVGLHAAKQTASLDPNDPNCPRSDRARLVGSIVATCVERRIVFLGRHEIALRSNSHAFGEKTSQISEEVNGDPKTFIEGTVRKVLVNAYERDPIARNKCIEIHA
jgi:hypothetical protein